jgi:hypothetical protein
MVAIAGTDAGSPRAVCMDLGADKQIIGMEDRTKSFVEGRCLSYTNVNHTEVECAASKKTYTIRMAVVGVKAIETSCGSEKLGNDQVNQRQFTL